MNKSIYLLIAVGLGVSVNVQAQTKARTGEEDTLRNSIIMVNTYKPTVTDAKKITVNPNTVDTVLEKKTVRYMHDNVRFETTFSPDTIKPAKMKSEPLDPLYRAHVKAGVGNGINYLTDIYVNSLRSREGSLGFKLHGFGTQGNLAEAAVPAPYSNWNGEVFGKKFYKKHALSGQVGFDRERVQYYGYDDQNPYYFDVANDVFKQVYNNLYADVKLKSFYADSSKLNHEFGVGYNLFNDLYGSNTEHNVVLNGNINKFFGEHQFDLGIIGDFNNVNYTNDFIYLPYDSIAQSSNNFIVNLHPKFISKTDVLGSQLKVQVGLQLQAEIASNGSSPYVYPDLKAQYNLVKELLVPYANLRGFFGRGVTRTNLSSLSELNPFLWTSLTPLQNEKEMYSLSGGFRGAVSQRFTYNLFAGIRKVENLPLFENYNASQFNLSVNEFGENLFMINYDTVQITEIGGELTYRVNEKLQLLGSGVYRSFNTTSEFEAWQLPIFESHLSGFYQLRNKIIVKGQAHIYGPRKAKSYNTSDDFIGYDSRFDADVYAKSLPMIFDLSLGLEYRYTERISAFVTFHNIAAQKYQYWNQYATQRFNVMGGITCSFWKE